jgi:hypothetical protein
VAQIEAICTRHAVPLKAAALQFPLFHPCVASVIPGTRSPEELAENLRMLRVEIPPALWSELKASNLLHATAPTHEPIRIRMIIDAHHHIWKLARGGLWLDWRRGQPRVAAIERDYLLHDFVVLARQNAVAGSVVVQAAQTIDETRWLLAQARAQ